MADNIYDMTPGSAAAEALQNVLAQKRMRERQQMLDQLNVQNTQSEMGYRAQQAQSLKDMHEANAEWRKAQANEKTESVARHKQFRQNFEKWMASPEFKALPADQQQAYTVAGMSPDDDLTKAVLTNFTRHQSSDDWNPVYTSEGEDTGNWAPPGAHFLPREPKETVDSYIPFGLDPVSGRPITLNNHSGVPYTIDDTGKRVPYTGKVGPKPTAGHDQKRIPMYDKVAWTNYFKATRKNKPGALSHAINSITDRNLRADITSIANGKDENGNSLLNHPVEELIAGMTPPEGVDPETAKAYLQDAADILREAKGGQQ